MEKKKELAVKCETKAELSALEKHFNVTYNGFAISIPGLFVNNNDGTYRMPDLDQIDRYADCSFGAFSQLFSIEVPKEEVVIGLSMDSIAKVFNDRVEFWHGDNWDFTIKGSKLCDIHAAFTSLTPSRQ